jgi:hypothetical protein
MRRNYSKGIHYKLKGHKMSHPIVPQNNSEYKRQYVTSLLNSPQSTIAPPDPNNITDSGEMLIEFHSTHKRLGPEAVRNQISKSLETPGLSNHHEWLRECIEPSRKRLFHEDELDNIPDSAWLIDGEIPENGLTILYGASGAGKSFVGLDYAKQISKDAPVIYVAAEDSAGYRDRKDAWNKHHQSSSGQLYFYLDAPNLLDISEVEAFILEVESRKPKLVIFDTLARCMIGDENSARDMGLMVRHSDLIMQRLNTSVMLVHHTGKKGNGERGSSALRGAADMMIELSSVNNVITLKCSKSKNTAGFETKKLRLLSLQIDEERNSCVIVDSSEVIVAEDELGTYETSIIEWLSSSDLFDQGARAKDLMTATEIPRGSFYRVIKSLMQRNLVKKDGKYDPYILTKKGENLAILKGFKI